MVRWDAENERKLLLEVLAVCEGKVDLEAVARRIGQGCTKEAVRQHIKSLRKVATAHAAGSADRGDEAPVTPQKRKRKQSIPASNTTTPTKGARGALAKVKLEQDRDHGDDDDDDERPCTSSPAKRV